MKAKIEIPQCFSIVEHKEDSGVSVIAQPQNRITCELSQEDWERLQDSQHIENYAADQSKTRTEKLYLRVSPPLVISDFLESSKTSKKRRG